MQGKLRTASVTVRVETECAHCAKPMGMEIDNNLLVTPDDDKCEPVIFVPDIDLLNLKEDSIIDSF